MSTFPSIIPDVLTRFLDPAQRYHVAQSASLGNPLVRMKLRIPTMLPTSGAPTMILTDNSPTPNQGETEYPTVGEPDVRGMGENWFEAIHVLPRRVDLGNVLTTIVVDFDVYSAFREQHHTWSNLVNNLGAGVTFIGLPTLPTVIPAQSGFLFQMAVSPFGPPVINSSLDFIFDLYDIPVPVTGRRITMFPFRPQAPIVERLLFFTQVMEALDGSEQRIALRRAPRQQFDLTFVVRDGESRQRIENLMFDWQDRVFGLPMWHEPAQLSAPASAGQFSVNVSTTSFADFRVGGLAIVFRDSQSFDALEISAIGPSSLTFTSPLVNDYPVGTAVFPLRTAIAQGFMQNRRYAGDGEEIGIRFLVIDNDVNLANTSAFATLNGKVLLDDLNFADSLEETLERRVTIIDNETGVVSQRSVWDKSKRSSSKTFFSKTRQRTWEVRQLLHALRGRQVSFYMPNRAKDLTPVQPLLNGTNTMTVANTGYARFVQSRSPRNLIRVNLLDGTQIIRTIVGAAEIDPSQELITLSATWGSTITPAQIDRVETLELVRIDTDEIVLTHDNAGQCEVSFPVKVVFE